MGFETDLLSLSAATERTLSLFQVRQESLECSELRGVFNLGILPVAGSQQYN
jgi:hypothetical protein